MIYHSAITSIILITNFFFRPMPDIDGLMQEWPQEFEERLNQIGLPIGDLECDLLTLVDIICCKFIFNCKI